AWARGGGGAGKGGRAARTNGERAAGVTPGTRLAVAIAPGFTIGFVRPSVLRSTASVELNGNPVAFTPSLVRASSGPSASHTRAKTNGFATLISVNSTPASPDS